MTEEPIEKLTLTVPEVAAILRISRGAAYEAAKTGALPGVLRFGRTIRISRYALNQFLSAQGTNGKTEEVCSIRRLTQPFN